MHVIKQLLHHLHTHHQAFALPEDTHSPRALPVVVLTTNEGLCRVPHHASWSHRSAQSLEARTREPTISCSPKDSNSARTRYQLAGSRLIHPSAAMRAEQDASLWLPL
ncbi:hypothetical protein CBOM_07864 [Ceraceosorus bombacis]|uniref:Uncharacterized protein n=1 Tax=Ceraceosorus bombacis TaxID=401625 RepID=A0A0N7LB48_9BASI|nr:hypothetical protein CBOM_07864 [Ceraceosorus bombacis]